MGASLMVLTLPSLVRLRIGQRRRGAPLLGRALFPLGAQERQRGQGRVQVLSAQDPKRRARLRDTAQAPSVLPDILGAGCSMGGGSHSTVAALPFPCSGDDCGCTAGSEQSEPTPVCVTATKRFRMIWQSRACEIAILKADNRLAWRALLYPESDVTSVGH